jgi:eukaryotic-like serine/threonine-protein kinase
MELGGSLRRRRGGGRRGGGSSRTGTGGGGARRSLLGVDPRWVLIGLGVLLLGSWGGYLYATQVVFPGAERTASHFEPVPDLRGTSLMEAEQLLEGQRFRMGRVDSIQHPRAQTGVVVGQTPLPGQLLEAEGVVELTLSLGPERRPVPDVTRLRADRAITVLRTTGFEVMVDSVEADEP